MNIRSISVKFSQNFNRLHEYSKFGTERILAGLRNCKSNLGKHISAALGSRVSFVVPMSDVHFVKSLLSHA
ncbi:CLUMA_CG020780, isoform A [Clunio marinus]|uniref:CLUMA_CG020780, isoform A n=1 Tax=Clunio marinus TaxID=568069 RepID=A0A1J1J766_9DIPT|nr:CLUMA_CG020780, isoform A [Clunio marinus]